MSSPDQATILVAAYGTARPGHGLYDQIVDSVCEYKLSRIMGLLYWHKNYSYPVADLSSERSTIVTTTLEMTMDANTMGFFKTELLCGYTPVWVDELDRDTEAPTGRKVIAFDYNHDLSTFGARIPSGDWNRVCSDPIQLGCF